MRYNMRRVAERAGLRREVIELLLQAIIDILADGDEVYLEGFGAFHQFRRAARKFQTPMIPGGYTIVPEGMTVRWRAAPKFRKLVRGS